MVGDTGPTRGGFHGVAVALLALSMAGCHKWTPMPMPGDGPIAAPVRVTQLDGTVVVLTRPVVEADSISGDTRRRVCHARPAGGPERCAITDVRTRLAVDGVDRVELRVLDSTKLLLAYLAGAAVVAFAITLSFLSDLPG